MEWAKKKKTNQNTNARKYKMQEKWKRKKWLEGNKVQKSNAKIDAIQFYYAHEKDDRNV